jgi:hypothetical protein
VLEQAATVVHNFSWKLTVPSVGFSEHILFSNKYILNLGQFENYSHR